MSRKSSRAGPPTRPSSAPGPSSHIHALEPADLVDVAGGVGRLDPGVELGRRPLLEVGVRRAAYGCADERQAGHAVGVCEREVDRGLAAHRARDDDGLLEAGSVEDGQRVADGRPAVLVRVHGLAEATHVIRDAAVTRAESLDDVPPAASIVDAGMDQQDVRAAVDARDLVGRLGTP